MDLIAYREFCLGMKGVEEKMPFGKFARRYESTLVFYVCGHMFALCDIDDFSYVGLRSTEEAIAELFQIKTSVAKPHNPALKLWINISFNGEISDAEIYRLTREAYQIIKTKYSSRNNNR